MDDAALKALADLPALDGVSIAALALEHLPLSATIVKAIREDGRIIDFCIVYSNRAATAISADRTDTYGKPLGEVVPAFAELGLCERYAEVVEGGGQYTAEGVRITGEYEGVRYGVVVDLVAVPLGGDLVLSVSHDRTIAHALGGELAAAQETLRRRREMDRQLRAINSGLVDDLVQVRRALEANDVRLADEHAARGAERAADVVLGLRNIMLQRPSA